MLHFILFIWVIASSLLSSAYAASTPLGHTYPIQEQDLLEWIQNKAHLWQENGAWPGIQKKWQTQAQSKAERPTPVTGLSVATQERRWLFDPSITLQQPIKRPDGTVWIPSGTRVNPLHTVPLKTPLIFYNADDPKQVNWAECQW